MKQKLLAALEQRYGGAIGSKNEIYEKVVTAYGNLITSEEQIPDIVAGVEPLLKQFQSVNDKLRAFENKQKHEPTPPPSDPGNQPNPNPEPPKQDEVPAWAQTLIDSNNAQKEYIKTLSEELATIKAAKAKEDAVSALDNFVNGWDYASGFPKERDLAKRVAMKVYRAGGEQMNGEQLIAAFREEFDPAVKEKGVTDFSQPFKGDGGGGEAEADFSSFDRAAQELGWAKPDK
jgi:hypothetical protein